MPDLRLRLLIDSALRVRAHKAREDFNEFVGYVLRDNFGHPVTQGMIHRSWQLHLKACWKAGLHPAILAPMSHGKTVQLIVARSAWEIGRDTNIRAKIVCNGDDNAKKRVQEVSRLITAKQYRRVFPNVVPSKASPGALKQFSLEQWNAHNLVVERTGSAVDPTLQAVGVFSTGIGGRADFLLFDDVVDLNNAILKPALRQKVIDTFEDVWLSRLEPWGRVVYIGTPWHEADLTHHLMKHRAWCVLKQSISLDCKRIDCEVYNPPADYPLEKLQRAA